MIKVCIIEDEPEIRKLLCKIIQRQEAFQVVAESGDFASAISDFTKYRPDVAFVDIDLQGESGLECAKVLTELNPKLKVIFATAHSEYMANAFEIYAFDYIVKPFDVERVVQTLSRIQGQLCPGPEQDAVIPGNDSYSDKLLIKGKEQIDFVNIEDIILIERSRNVTRIVTKEEALCTSVSLASLEEKLNPARFMRCHKSYIVNLDKISKIEPYGRWTYVVKFKGCKETALLTSARYEEVKKRFE